jgi:hypothetical protein
LKSWNVFRARAAWVLANLIALAGFAAMIPLLLAAFVPGAEAMHVLALVPELPASLAQVKRIAWIPAGIVMPVLVALGGLAVMFAGRAIASRQVRLIETHRHWHEDALRRARYYRDLNWNDGRIEPTLGAQAGTKQTA